MTTSQDIISNLNDRDQYQTIKMNQTGNGQNFMTKDEMVDFEDPQQVVQVNNFLKDDSVDWPCQLSEKIDLKNTQQLQELHVALTEILEIKSSLRNFASIKLSSNWQNQLLEIDKKFNLQNFVESAVEINEQKHPNARVILGILDVIEQLQEKTQMTPQQSQQNIQKLDISIQSKKISPQYEENKLLSSRNLITQQQSNSVLKVERLSSHNPGDLTAKSAKDTNKMNNLNIDSNPVNSQNKDNKQAVRRNQQIRKSISAVIQFTKFKKYVNPHKSDQQDKFQPVITAKRFDSPQIVKEPVKIEQSFDSSMRDYMSEKSPANMQKKTYTPSHFTQSPRLVKNESVPPSNNNKIEIPSRNLKIGDMSKSQSQNFGNYGLGQSPRLMSAGKQMMSQVGNSLNISGQHKSQINKVKQQLTQNQKDNLFHKMTMYSSFK